MGWNKMTRGEAIHIHVIHKYSRAMRLNVTSRLQHGGRAVRIVPHKDDVICWSPSNNSDDIVQADNRVIHSIPFQDATRVSAFQIQAASKLLVYMDGTFY